MKELIILENMTDCLMAEELIHSKGLRGRLIPTPPWISKGCGMAYLAEADDLEMIEEILREFSISFKLLPYKKKQGDIK